MSILKASSKSMFLKKKKDSADFWRKKNDFETEKFAIYDAKFKIQMESNVST